MIQLIEFASHLMEFAIHCNLSTAMRNKVDSKCCQYFRPFEDVCRQNNIHRLNIVMLRLKYMYFMILTLDKKITLSNLL
ncbi:MAG: hypothetical protein O7C59_08760, partial [Rickettsia endosymbiont of Ixodes persulcatus]|nr:hypothetical protein [Rickettsia endosymbiont of Ixodes persulcatus]